MAQSTQEASGTAASQGNGEHLANRLGAFLCWAVVFADIGTSIYYVPGILYGQVGGLAGLFVMMTMVVFLLLTLKYSEVSVRFPEGGGVVTVAARGLNPWAGAVGGMFILVDYFLTSAISSLSGLHYFTAVLPNIKPYVLPITLVVLALLGVLNWWGIKESAVFSAVIAVAAFISNIAILIAVFVTVPLHEIIQIFRDMFTGSHLGPIAALTGFAGAFLAFSGLESISQLSPVMKTPRSKTVTWALALVVITVGVTSPLLTIFSTRLLDAAHTDPDKFISELGGAFGGPVLAIATAVTASTLLIFASNTAIIGAYHVFLALSRMRFFPNAVEKHNKWRGTPHVAIILATVIPMAVLVAVGGHLQTLGDMYAFGLLGAFSLTCIALDIIRWRERHGEGPIGVHEETGAHAVASGAGRARALAAWLRPVAAVWRRWWPDARYYLGILTTILVVIAWATNLVSKPMATTFGGGLTVFGVAIAVVHYRYQERKGAPLVFPMHVLRAMPGSHLVVLSSASTHNDDIIRAAVEGADGHQIVFLYLGQRPQQPIRPMQFGDPYLYDEQAHRILSAASSAAARARIPASYVYRVGGPAAVVDVWRVIRPDEIIAEASLAKTLSTHVSPEYVRYQQVGGIRVAHYVRRHVSTLDTPEAGPGASVPGKPLRPPTKSGGPAPEQAPSAAEPGAGTAAGKQGASAEAAAPSGAQPEEPHRPPVDTETGLPSGTDIANYVWTGTKLVRKDELEDTGGREDSSEQ